jgi:hypothetical protein
MLIPVKWLYQEITKMKRTTLAQKREMIKSGLAYVAKCDGGFFFYLKNGTERADYVRISKEQYEELSYE